MTDGRYGAHGYVPKRRFQRKKKAVWRGARRLRNTMTGINCKKKVFVLEMKTRDTHISYNPVMCLYIHKHEKVTNYLKMKHQKKTWGINPMGHNAPWANSYFCNWKKYQNMTTKTRWILVENIYITQKHLQGINPIGLCALWENNYLHNWKPTYINHQNQLDKLGMTELKPFNQLMMTNEITKPAPFPRPSKNLQGE